MAEKIREDSLAVKEQFVSWIRKQQWKAEEKESEYSFIFKIDLEGVDFPIPMTIMIGKGKPVIFLYSVLPVWFSSEKRAEGLALINKINYYLFFGKLAMDPKNGYVSFLHFASFDGCLLSDEFFDRMIRRCRSHIDEFNDRLLMFSKGMVSAEEALKGAF